MVPALQFDNWQWLVAHPGLARSWSGARWPFHRAAWTNLRHGAATMDTLISVGVSAAYLWSLWALFFGDAGMTGMRHAVRADCPARRRGRGDDLPRGRRRGDRRSSSPAATSRPAPSGSPARRCGRCSTWAPRTSPSCATGPRGRREIAYAGRASSPSETCSWCAPARRSPPTGSWSTGTSAVDASMLTGESVPVEVGPGDDRRRRDGQRRRPARRAGDPGRRRHPAGPDGPAGRGRPERQGRRPAPGRPGLGGVRAHRHRPVAGDAGRLAAVRARRRQPRSPPPSPC